ncbi:MAG TPA: hypothetical protein VE046_01680 [Steroidobacteraceae bacterium]|nr:hypothetical protein [Steroidobacteraceae bacterium]
MEQASNAFRISRALAWLVIAASIVAPFLVLHSQGASPVTVGYDGSRFLLAMIAVVVVAALIFRREAPMTRTLALWSAALICLGLAAWSSFGGAQSASIEQEIAAARPKIDRLRKLVREENARLGSGTTQAPSPDFQAFVERAPPGAPELSDTSRPLGERLQELTRREGLTTVRLQRDFMRRLAATSDPDAFTYESLADDARRLASLAKLQSQRETMDWWYGQALALSAQNEADIRQLGMPATSTDEMLRGARRAQDEATPQLKAIVESRKSMIAAQEDAIKFAGDRTKSMRQNGPSIVFDNADDTAAFNAILQRAL